MEIDGFCTPDLAAQPKTPEFSEDGYLVNGDLVVMLDTKASAHWRKVVVESLLLASLATDKHFEGRQQYTAADWFGRVHSTLTHIDWITQESTEISDVSGSYPVDSSESELSYLAEVVIGEMSNKFGSGQTRKN